MVRGYNSSTTHGPYVINYYYSPVATTRKMLTETQVVNGLNASQLTTQSLPSPWSTESTYAWLGSGWDIYWGIRVWSRSINGVETELTSGTPVAIVGRYGISGYMVQSSTWNCPGTALNKTDSIVVRVYTTHGNYPWNSVANFTTERLGASHLGAATWTIFYYTNWYLGTIGGSIFTYGAFTWGYNQPSRIENFQIPRALSLEGVKSWYWTSSTTINSVAVGDVNGDGQKETVTGGSYHDGTRNVAQLIVWNSSSLAPELITTWYWYGNTTVNSVAIGDVDGDNQTEIVTGGCYFDGNRQVAQLIVWNGFNLAVEGVKTWYWTGSTVINSVALGDVDGDNQMEIVTGGYYNDGVRNIAQLVVWNGSNLIIDRLTTWYWTGNTVINSVALGDVDGDSQVEIVTGGYYFDGIRLVAQLVEWNGLNLSVDRLAGWYWTNNTAVNSVAVGDVNNDGQIEIVTGGYYYDGTRNVAQLVVWNGSNLGGIRPMVWYWTGNTVANSVALGDVDGDGQLEIVTGGYYFDGTRNNAQMIVWSGSNFAVENVRTWYWTGDTVINSVAAGDVNGNYLAEIVTGGAYFDGTRLNAQLTVWGMS